MGIAIQTISLVLLGIGIVCEFVYAADAYLVMITIGSAIFAIGTKIRRR